MSLVNVLMMKTLKMIIASLGWYMACEEKVLTKALMKKS